MVPPPMCLRVRVPRLSSNSTRSSGVFTYRAPHCIFVQTQQQLGCRVQCEPTVERYHMDFKFNSCHHELIVVMLVTPPAEGPLPTRLWKGIMPVTRKRTSPNTVRQKTMHVASSSNSSTSLRTLGHRRIFGPGSLILGLSQSPSAEPPTHEAPSRKHH